MSPPTNIIRRPASHHFRCALARVGLLSAALATSWLPLARPARAQPAPASGCGPENLLAGRAPASALEIVGDTALVTNGSVAAEGTNWDASPAVVLRSAAAEIVYDLGQLRTIAAVYVQADANDTYQVSGSDDGSPNSYHLIAAVENVLGGKGPGLRARWMTVPPTQARFVRFGDGRGDNFYSLSELAVYCAPPAHSPPAFKVVGGSAAPPPVDAVPSEGDQSAQTPARPYLGFLVAAAVLVLAGGLAARAARRARPAGAGQGVGDGSIASGAAADPNRPLLWLFVASGCAALIYEVVWLHLLRLVIGASALSVGIVLASFMGGMFLGSLYLARLVPPSKNPLRVYAALELGIGLFGLLMPALLPVVRSVYVGLFGYGALGIALRAVISVLLLLPPTALMGATLPAVARVYPRGPRGSSQLAALYAANTSGAVLGCLLSGFVLLAYGDVWLATAAAVLLNLAIAGASWRLSRGGGAIATHPSSATAAGFDAQDQPAAPALSSSSPPSPSLSPPGDLVLRSVYLAAGFSGFTALGAQVVWTRILTLLFGATVYAFAIILAVFLGGLGIGSALAAWWLRRGRDPVRALAMTQLLLIPALFLSGVLLAEVLPFASPSSATPIGPLHALHVLRAIDVILPAAILWGASFPFALAAAGAGHGDAARSSGHVYAANTVGAILAAVGVSFWAIPQQGTRWASQILLAAAAVSAALLFRALSRPGAGAPALPARSTGVALPAWSFWSLAVGALAVALLPGMSQVFMAHGRNIWWVNPHDKYLFVSEGAASTVAVHVGADGYRNFHVSGRVEASNNPNDMRLQRLLGHLSALAHPHPRSALVVGLGAGVTAGALTLHPEIDRIVICEIEPRVVGAARQFAVENYDVLTNPRVQVVFDDARHFLATTREKFDIITSDPIHPWVRGNSILFSREYYAIVRGRLNPGGIATQWVPLYETNEAAIKIQMRTFMDAFPDGTVWNSAVGGNGYDVVLLGRDQGLHLDLAEIVQRMARTPRITESLAAVKVRSPVDLLGTYAARATDLQSWLEGTPVNRDFSLKLEYISGLALNDKEADAIYAHMTEGRRFPDDLFSGPPALINELRRRIH